MLRRIVEIASDNRHLAVVRGFMAVSEDGNQLARVPLDDIAAVIANAHGLTYSNNLVLALAQRGAALILCGPNHTPAAFLWPVEGHHAQSARMIAQLDAPKPLRKRLWQHIVRAKILQQGAVAEASGGSLAPFEMFARRVKSGDPENVEAQAARRYWPMIMGSDFRRDRALGGANAMLNYGYTVLRAATARAVMAAGLHPSVGLHHYGPTNTLCLVDDLMEPFRPLVDLLVARLHQRGDDQVTPGVKKMLVDLMYTDLQTERGVTPLMICLERLATSLAASFDAREPRLDFPSSPLPLYLAQLGHSAGPC